MPFKYLFTVLKESFFVAFLKHMYAVSDFCKNPRPTSSWSFLILVLPQIEHLVQHAEIPKQERLRLAG